MKTTSVTKSETMVKKAEVKEEGQQDALTEESSAAEKEEAEGEAVAEE